MLAVAGFRINNSTTIKGLNASVMNNIMDKLHIWSLSFTQDFNLIFTLPIVLI